MKLRLCQYCGHTLFVIEDNGDIICANHRCGKTVGKLQPPPQPCGIDMPYYGADVSAVQKQAAAVGQQILTPPSKPPPLPKLPSGLLKFVSLLSAYKSKP